ncbi:MULTISPECIES: FCD domain-containing protein [Pseudomonas]|uniref:DNA-binding FadR family transcriptional regulator n=3 Tax=Pseudomonadaceae TaxID=135621 RepID=A0A3D9EGB4_ECTOL|nr:MULTISPECIES: FCD domain-containing protein [Pseudomonas]APQ11008.1 GntR family transcriptional regulator [Pseudomonas psychrotolerans]KTT25483.1 GntR family transcriptional regulator [Pseudomonas psychrotolerans]KTT53399.1 GntR family transcriptional regulator [Pseudomonas psychrotolerans]NMZ44190.1 FadR family transcriptional regulator [Pseudomonas oryzihabitans]RED02062.1 DNA-binding FadR family transcriptional regulator [Pseudomonas oleovorans]
MSQFSSLIRLNQEGKTEAVTRHLIEMVEVGLLAEGEQLPNETTLAAQLGVAPVTLRDALANLRSQGIIETRRGRGGGSFVRARPAIADAELFARLERLTALELRDHADEHVAISGAAAQLAAKRAGADQHRRLARLLAEFAVEVDVKRQRQLDARFHIEIAVAAQSVRLTHNEVRLQAELGELLWLPYRGQPDIAAMRVEHQAILEAIVSNDANLAGALAQAHVSRELRRLTALKLEVMAAD